MKEVEVKLLMLNGWVYILTKGKMIKVSNRKLRYDGIPRKLMEHAIIKSPNDYVTVFHLEDEGVKTSRDFMQIAYSAGFSGQVKKYFLKDCATDFIKIADKVVLTITEVEELINDIQRRKAGIK